MHKKGEMATGPNSFLEVGMIFDYFYGSGIVVLVKILLNRRAIVSLYIRNFINVASKSSEPIAFDLTENKYSS